jgi:hypothetical protein
MCYNSGKCSNSFFFFFLKNFYYSTKTWYWRARRSMAKFVSMSLRLKAGSEPTDPNPDNESGVKRQRQRVDLRNGSEIVYMPSFLPFHRAWDCFHYLNDHIPWTRPTIRVFGRSCVQVKKSKNFTYLRVTYILLFLVFHISIYFVG